MLVTLALALVLLAGGSAALILVLLKRFTALADGTALAALSDAAPATWKTAFTLAGTLATLLGLSRFLTTHLGAAEAWATFEETDEKYERRSKIIDLATATLKHVLCDPRCDRVIVVGHSLGSAIAQDALSALARDNRARQPQDPILGPVPLLKIEHFITFGSPIDKIEYFFESYRSPFHRYRRVVESLRGDIGSEPFCRNHKPFIHWINFWDDADIVSGALRSPASHAGFAQRVDNVHVANLAFPDPRASHDAYFHNRHVIACLFDAIYHRGRSFRTLPVTEGVGQNWEGAFLGPAIDPPGKRRLWTVLATALPWLALAALAAAFGMPEWGLWPWLPAAAGLATLLAGYAIVGRKDRLRRRLDRAATISEGAGEPGSESAA
jgi:hypothetical protein